MAEQHTGVLAGFGTRLGGLMRITRIVMCILISLALTMLIWVGLAYIFGDGVTDPDPGAIPTIAVLAGIAVYVVTWWALIGFVRGDSAELPGAGTPAAILLLAGVIAFVLDVVIVIALLA